MTPGLKVLVEGLRIEASMGSGIQAKNALLRTAADALHAWFELSYAHYLTIPRSILQSMPIEWQERFAACLRELDAALPWRPTEGRYWVKLKDDRGRYVCDPFDDYRHVGAYSAEDVARLRGRSAREGQ
jgi:hypothetical protein